MRRWDRIESIQLQASVVTLGNFDGVHVGHRPILQRVGERSSELGIPSVAITFNPHPTLIVGREPPALLSTIEQRMESFERLGIQHAVAHPFTEEISQLPAREFIRQYLVEHLRAKVLCVGPTTHIGRGREGTPERIRQEGRSLGLEVEIIPAERLGGEIVSSSRIRAVLRDGDVGLAAQLLGGWFESRGTIVTGAARGRTLGFPTANLGGVQTMLPRIGVYATWFELEGRRLPSVTNVGVRPTVDLTSPVTVETHVLDFQGDLVAKEVRLFWVERLREERKFATLVELTGQIQADVEQARGILENRGTKGTTFDENGVNG